MRIFRHYDTLPADARGACIAVGNFDGVHLGHEAVIGEAGRAAEAMGAPWAVLTFEPHPRSVFVPDQPPFRLTPFRAKADAIARLGVDILIVQRFNRAFSENPAEVFVTDVLSESLGARHVVAGYDFVFGHQRKGTCEMLLAMGQELDFGFTAVSAVGKPETIYSSTGVRECLRSGDPRGAAAILGRPFEITGRVCHGDSRGHDLGYPTANLHLGSYLRPLYGIYAVRVTLAEADGDAGAPVIDGVANLGIRPMWRSEVPLLEVHLFDFDGDLYGRRVSVQLIEYLREEKKFDDVAALQAQIAADCADARRVLAEETETGT